jgi:hypothetical protein
MTCNLKLALLDRDLLAYLDGEATEEVIFHLEHCDHCRQRAQALADQEESVLARLYRTACPDAHLLGEYHLGFLSGREAENVAQHLAGCPHCRHELAQLEDFVGELAPTLELGRLDQARQSLRVWIARLLDREAGASGPGLPALAPLGLGVRGEDNGPQLYQAGAVQLSIDLQADSQRPDRNLLLGLMIGVDPAGFEAHLWRAGRHLLTVPVDELGNFAFPDLEAGRYDLIVAGPDTEIHVQDFQVGRGGV